MQNKIFVDSNIWLYLFLQDNDEKYKIAEKYFLNNSLNTNFIVSYQVINEISNILFKNKYLETEIMETIENLFKICTIQEFTKEILLIGGAQFLSPANGVRN